jgi:hypothetical protein
MQSGRLHAYLTPYNISFCLIFAKQSQFLKICLTIFHFCLHIFEIFIEPKDTAAFRMPFLESFVGKRNVKKINAIGIKYC